MLIGAGLASADIGFDGCGDVRRPRIRIQFGVKVWRGVDDQLNRSSGLPSGIGCYTCELSRVLKIIEKEKIYSNVSPQK